VTKNFPLAGCCAFCNNRLGVWAVINGDIDGLKLALMDTEGITNPFQPYSKDNPITIFSEALKERKDGMLEEIFRYLKQNSATKGGI